MQYDQAYQMGYDDYMRDVATNPFCGLTDEGRAWLAGWNAAYHVDVGSEEF